MKLVAQLKLLPDAAQAAALHNTVETANAACDFVSRAAWREKTFKQFDLHHLCYRTVRDKFGLSAQVAVHVCAKVADAYKLDRKTRRTFKPLGAVAYDDRIVSYRLADSTVSIWTVAGRLRIPFVCGDRQRELLKTRVGESDLALVRGCWILSATCDVEEPAVCDVEGVLGVDLGVVNIAVDSDGEIHSGKQVNNVRRRHRRLRKKLQAKGTHSAKRKLKKLSGKETRFARDVNHVVSKSIVQKAKGTRRAVALEDLSGIRGRLTVRRLQRDALTSWSFFQLRTFVEYKGRLAGVPVLFVDPRNTSRTCPACGHIDKRNRPYQAKFQCVLCGHSGLADRIAAENIRRAGVNQPIATNQKRETKQHRIPRSVQLQAAGFSRQ
jgi:putative transposase